ncbi:MAG: hypothetical protein A2138_17430 [Deltaproteobacteria bacterium RBG_16_71_12]|nr:MAG: hypothetical protein A2138_17430 [Deltaproteobacteria bacterium RBG_16_71_12]
MRTSPLAPVWWALVGLAAPPALAEDPGGGWVQAGSITINGVELAGDVALGVAAPAAGGAARVFMPASPGLAVWISDPQTFLRLDVSYLLLGAPTLLDPAADPLLVDVVLPRTGPGQTERGAHNHLVRFRSGRSLTQLTDQVGLGAALVFDWGNLGTFPAGDLTAPIVGGDSFAVGVGPSIAWVPLANLAVYASADIEGLARFREPWLRGVGVCVDGDIVFNLVPRILSIRGGLGVSSRFFLEAVNDPAPGTGVGVDANVGLIVQWDWLLDGSGAGAPTSTW